MGGCLAGLPASQLLAPGRPVACHSVRLPGGQPCTIYYPAQSENNSNNNNNNSNNNHDNSNNNNGNNNHDNNNNKNKTRLLVEPSLAEVAVGYAHVMFKWLRRWPLVCKAVRTVMQVVQVVFPVSWQRAPCVEGGAPAAGPWPLVLFSHGLTGSGVEHTLLFIGLARQGFAVATLTHTDGSASSVDMGCGKELLIYQHADFLRIPTAIVQQMITKLLYFEISPLKSLKDLIGRT
ncbi:unnamed protein product [Polarella glacialis]|uniref:1-alkyl-2-acetylglycerophosphocholine esterase n=1 Tax=Polarella glacialis TaxID=89957 RepID=A0A813JZQ5_POLGL|nr:unnamed protein product [Polarella glacialis]